MQSVMMIIAGRFPSSKDAGSAAPMRQWYAAAIVAVLGFFGVPGAVEASSIAVLVNDEPITDYDVAQRTRLIEATSGGRGGGREQAIEELIDERLKMQAARRMSVAVAPSEVDQAFAQIASRVELAPAQFTQALGQIGVNPETLRKRLEADLAWRDVVRARLRQEIDIRATDVEAAVAQRGEAAKSTSYELTLQQIMFVIPTGSSAEYARQRRREAEAFRARFSGCESAMELSGNYRDTVVQPQVRRNASELPDEMRETLLAIQPGKVGAPNQTEKAIEMVAVCERREVQDTTAARTEIQSTMMNEQGERLARRLLIDLKQAAIIERR